MRSSRTFDASSIILAFSLNLFGLKSVSAFNQCYFPDGSIPEDYIWEPCTGAQYSSCCVPSEGDVCQPNGLCYFPETGELYRGTCTDRTWNDPSCNVDICVTGFETTWTWVLECESSSTSSYACGNVTDNVPQAATCPGSAQTEVVSIQTTTTTTSAGRYTPPPPIDTSLYSVYTDTYTTIMTADAQSTTLTSIFQSTFTSTLSPPTFTSAGQASTASSSSYISSAGTKRVALGTGVIIAIIVGPTLAVAVGLAIFFFMRKKSKKNAAIRLNTPPPPNGPVGADQVNPYEMEVREASNQHRPKYEYNTPPVESYEASGQNGFEQEKVWGQQGPNRPTEIGGGELRSPRSPAPMYSEAVAPVEMDGTSSFRGRSEY